MSRMEDRARNAELGKWGVKTNEIASRRSRDPAGEADGGVAGTIPETVALLPPDGAEVSGPETSAGQRLLSILGGTADADYLSPIANAILAIEAEARAAAVAPLEKALGEAVLWMGHDSNCPWRYTNGKEPCRCEMPALRDRFVALLSAPSPVREPEGLDVERLATAMLILDEADPGVFNIVAISDPDTRPVAVALAAEYARLTPERPADEPDRAAELAAYAAEYRRITEDPPK